MTPAWLPVLEVGGTHVTSAQVDGASLRVAIGSIRRRPIDTHGSAAAILDAIGAAAADLSMEHGGVWGVAMPGPFDYARGIARFAGVGKFESLHGVDVRAELIARIRPAPEAIRFLNDADAFVLGEWAGADGALRGTDRCAGFTLGTGIGSAFLASGRLVHSGTAVPLGGRADEITIDARPLEEWVSRRAIRRAFAARTGDHRADVREIVSLARSSSSGDATHAAEAVLADAFRMLGRALGPVLAEFAAERVVVGGSMAAGWDLFARSFAAGCVRAGVAVPPVVVSADPERAALVGAAGYARSSR